MEFDENLNPIRPNPEGPTPPPSPQGGFTPPQPAPTPQSNWVPTPPPPVPPATPPVVPPPAPRPLTFGPRSSAPLGLLLAGIAGLIVLALAAFGLSSNRNLPGPNTGVSGQTEGLSVSAEGLVYATPDIAKLRFGVQQVGREASAVENEISQKIDTIKTKIKELGIEDKDIKTAEFGIYPDYGAYPPTANAQIRSYNGRHILEVTVRNLDKANAVADAVIAAGANEVQNIYYTVEDPEEWYQEARSQAITKAKEKATQLAEDADIRLGRLLTINESTGGPIFYDRAVGTGGAEYQPGLEPGNLEIRASVTLVYQIK